MTYEELPFSGIATFFKAPYIPAATTPTPSSPSSASRGILGTTARSGARMGRGPCARPRRLWAFQQDHDHCTTASPARAARRRARAVAATWRRADVVAGALPHAVIDKLRPLMEAGLFPVTLGGDHSIGYPVLKALHQARGGKPVHLVQFDTHMDYWDEEGGQRWSHASPIIRSHEAGFLSGLTQYGIRSLHTAGDNIKLARSRGARIFWCQRAKDMLVDDLVEQLPQGEDVYITLRHRTRSTPRSRPRYRHARAGRLQLLRGQEICSACAPAGNVVAHGPGRGGTAVRRPAQLNRTARGAPHSTRAARLPRRAAR